MPMIVDTNWITKDTLRDAWLKSIEGEWDSHNLLPDKVVVQKFR